MTHSEGDKYKEITVRQYIRNNNVIYQRGKLINSRYLRWQEYWEFQWDPSMTHCLGWWWHLSRQEAHRKPVKRLTLNDIQSIVHWFNLTTKMKLNTNRMYFIQDQPPSIFVEQMSKRDKPTETERERSRGRRRRRLGMRECPAQCQMDVWCVQSHLPTGDFHLNPRTTQQGTKVSPEQRNDCIKGRAILGLGHSTVRRVFCAPPVGGYEGYFSLKLQG